MIKSCVIGLSKVGKIHCESLLKIKKTSLNYIFDKNYNLVFPNISLQKNSVNKAFGSKFPPSYPNEMVVKLCSSKKYSDLTKNILDSLASIGLSPDEKPINQSERNDVYALSSYSS